MGCAGGILAQGMSLEDQVASFVYYRTLGTCLVDGGPNLKDGSWFDGGERINQAHAKSGEWFAQAQSPGGVYLDGRSGVTARVDTTGATECAQTGLVTGALSLWDGWAPDQALCAMGMRRASDAEFNAKRCTDEQGASDEFKRGDDMLGRFKKGVSDRVYGGKEPTITANAAWTDAGTYLLYLKTFKLVCVPKATVTTSKPTGTTDKDFSLRTPSRSGDTVSFTTTYYLGLSNRSQGDGAVTVAGASLSRITGMEGTTCGGLMKAINGDDGKENGLADAYGKYLFQNQAAPDTSGGDGQACSTDGTCPADAASCGGLVQGIGWMVCPLLNGIGGLNDMMWGLIVSNLLNVNPLEQSGSIYQLWGILRSIANVLLIVAFLVIVFSQLTSAGVSNYGVKKMLPRLVIAAIAINISFFLVALAVDVFNIAGTSIYDILKGVADQSKSVPTWDNLIGIIVGLGVGVGIGIAGISAAGGAGAALLLLLPAAALAVLGFVVALVVLMLRQALIPLLAVLAPIAIVMYLFPNTEPWFTKWRKALFSMLLLYPIAAFLFGGLQVVAIVIAGDNANWFSTLTALVVMAAPLFMLPFIARQAGPMLGKIGGTLGGLTERARKPLQGWAGSRAGLSRAKYLGAPIRTGKNGKPILRDRVRAGAQTRSNRAYERDVQTAAWNAETQAAAAKGVGDNADALAAGLPATGAGAAHIRAVAARAQSEEIKTAMDSMKIEAGFNPNDRTALARTLAEALQRGDTTRATAATNYLVGARGVDELHSTLSAAQSAGHMTPDLSTAMQRAMTSAENGGVIKERRPDLTSWGATGGDIASVSSNASTWSISADDAAGLSVGALRAAQATGGMPADIAQRVLDTPQLRGKLDVGKEAVMMSIAGRAAPRTVGPVGSESQAPTSGGDDLQIPHQ